MSSTIKMHVKDKDIRGSLPALRRAAVEARRIARATGTPVYVWENGRVVREMPAARPILAKVKA